MSGSSCASPRSRSQLASSQLLQCGNFGAEPPSEGRTDNRTSGTVRHSADPAQRERHGSGGKGLSPHCGDSDFFWAPWLYMPSQRGATQRVIIMLPVIQFMAHGAGRGARRVRLRPFPSIRRRSAVDPRTSRDRSRADPLRSGADPRSIRCHTCAKWRARARAKARANGLGPRPGRRLRRREWTTRIRGRSIAGPCTNGPLAALWLLQSACARTPRETPAWRERPAGRPQRWARPSVGPAKSSARHPRVPPPRPFGQ